MLAATALLAVGVRPVAAATAQTRYAVESATSNNWAGYVVGGKTFSNVSGSWVVPTAHSDTDGYSATWVGLGGASSSSSALEQVGTESDYADGQATYSAWCELVPKAPVTLKLTVRPGDHMTGKVTVSGTQVTVAIADTTTGTSVTKTLRMSDPDTSSAEWVAEAPSLESGDGNAQVVPLADFGTVAFTGATATADGHTGSISDGDWSAYKVDLVSDQAGAWGGGRMFGPDAVASGTGTATTSALARNGSSFSVRWTAAEAAAGSGGDGGYGPGGDGGGGYGGYGGGGYGGYGGGGYGGGWFS
ncbi:MAG TPA: G1 family glutamic endopeptidase [Solirubrobacter sp.]|nr:G1 family glutamic endopeptidase [Solirubrobacter sp.]